MQVVVPSVPLAAVLQGTALTVSVEIPSLATMTRPVWLFGSSALPGCGARLGFAGASVAGAISRVEGGGLPAVPVVC